MVKKKSLIEQQFSIVITDLSVQKEVGVNLILDELDRTSYKKSDCLWQKLARYFMNKKPRQDTLIKYARKLRFLYFKYKPQIISLICEDRFGPEDDYAQQLMFEGCKSPDGETSEEEIEEEEKSEDAQEEKRTAEPEIKEGEGERAEKEQEREYENQREEYNGAGKKRKEVR